MKEALIFIGKEDLLLNSIFLSIGDNFKNKNVYYYHQHYKEELLLIIKANSGKCVIVVDSILFHIIKDISGISGEIVLSLNKTSISNTGYTSRVVKQINELFKTIN